jgi:MYXO-CTERM domain-containing protein
MASVEARPILVIVPLAALLAFVILLLVRRRR